MSLNLIIPYKIQKLEIMYKASFEMVLLIIMRGKAVEQKERRILPSVGLVGKRRGMGDGELGYCTRPAFPVVREMSNAMLLMCVTSRKLVSIETNSDLRRHG